MTTLLDKLGRTTKRPASRTDTALEQRKVQFDWEHTELDWIPGEPFASHFINEINMILPAGEFWFCRLYNKALPMITDAKLKEDVRGFIKQEAMHARGHSDAISNYLEERGINTSRNQAVMNFLFEQVLADAPFGKPVPKWFEKRWLLLRLGLVATIEHMTCVLGKYALENDQWDKAGADAMLLDLIRWHGAEEIEHRNVAFDLYQHLGGDYLSRYYLAAIVVPMIFGLWVDGAAHVMGQDPRFAAKKPSVFKPWVWLQWQKTAKKGLLPKPLWLALSNLSYFSPWYNPAKEGSTEQAQAYLKRSPAAQAARSIADTLARAV
ncbi:metal-dependent hydrolase [Limnobacter sp.]|uniref:metal-dependent hydrolase n=1 Tax=Limnobacter sp. TaxID=2003368 RepID=UPI00258DC6A8|nr:metal-dependent hydrolase [Limnobacter sp.]